MKAIAYVRTPPGGSASMLQQEEAFHGFCRAQGYEAAPVFRELDPGARQEFRLLMDYLRGLARGEYVVVIHSAEVAGTSPWEQARSLLEMEVAGAPVVYSARPTSQPLQEALAAASQPSDRGKRIKEAMRSRAIMASGLGKPPYGYRVGRGKRLVVESPEGEVVKLVFRLYTEDGLGLRRIAALLNERGHRTRRGGAWSVVSLRDILKNRTYTGLYARFGSLVPGGHEALVTRETFHQAQETMVSRKPERQEARRQPFLLSALAYCGYCGNRMIGVTRRQGWTRQDGGRKVGTYRYYQCQSRTNQSTCRYHTWRVEKLEALLLQRLREGLEHAPPPPKGRAAGHLRDAVLEGHRSRVKAQELRLRRLIQDAASGRTSIEALKATGAGLLAQIAELESAMAALESTPPTKLRAIDERRRLKKALAEVGGEWEGIGFDQRRALLEQALERAIVLDDNVVVSLRV